MDRVEALLSETLAERAGQAPTGPVPLVERSRRIRMAMTMIAASIVVIVAAVTVGVTHLGPHHRTPSRTAATYSPNSLPGPTGPRVTASQLKTYVWRTLPTAPIAPRDDAAAVWTGTEMIVWGGRNAKGTPLSDGATYNPNSRTWKQLPSSPLSPRIDPMYAWIDGQLVVWGGGTSDTSRRDLDGATYNPATGKWRKLPPSPIAGYQWAQAVPSGHTVIILSTTGRLSSRTIHAHAYHPATNTWSSLPDLHLPSGHDAIDVVVLPVGDTLFVWPEWQSSTAGATGIDSYALDAASGRWSAAGLRPPASTDVGQPVWTGHDVLMPTQELYCGDCPGPPPGPNPGLLIDPRTGKRTRTAIGPLSQAIVSYLWTGGALLAVNQGTTASDGRGTMISPGDTAGWNPTTNTWTRLTRAPDGIDGNGAILWTGTRLLAWGLNIGATQASTQADGLEFTR
jgi:Galactose oxidase, central domain